MPEESQKIEIIKTLVNGDSTLAETRQMLAVKEAALMLHQCDGFIIFTFNRGGKGFARLALDEDRFPLAKKQINRLLDSMDLITETVSTEKDFPDELPA